MNKKTIVFALALFFTGSILAQETRTIRVIVPNKTDEVYITGNQESLGNWNPNSIEMVKVSDYERIITVSLNYPAEFKFTKGDWNAEGIVQNLHNNPNLRLEDQNSKDIFMVKGWSNDTDGEALGLDYGIKNFQSKYLEDKRLIKIVLPDNYDPTKKYPVFYTTDGGGNIFSVAKNHLSNLSTDEYKLMPESILVAIVHGMTNNRSNRNDDLDVYYKETGNKFKDFLFKELIPYINNTYSTSNFNVMIGHSNGAEYNHFLLLEEDNPFRGFISLSTNFYSRDVRKELGDFMNNYRGKSLYYFVANATLDSPDRIEAGNDYEKIYNANTNDKFQFKKTTYKANHNSVVPLALSDGIQFIFKDYRNFETYENFASYRDNYLKDLKYTYGLEEAYKIDDTQSILMDIILNKNKEDLEGYLIFVDEEKLWKNQYMKNPGGFDAMNKGNFYFMIESYEESAEQYERAFEELEITVEPAVYYYNFRNILQSFKEINKHDELMDILTISRDKLSSDPQLLATSNKSLLLNLNYEIAKLSNEHSIDMEEGKRALEYCKNNYKKNKKFSPSDLEALE